ncbi:MAG: hypothetical protein KDD41_11960 [Flavobacteriales bacterium]|nr:hypothetical protein [Flavobacteriales bacterium]
MKRLTFIIAGFMLSLTSFAQGDYGATPEDSVKCIEHLIYKDYMGNDEKLALKLWRVAYNVCPKSQKTLYINGVKLYENLAKDAKDEATKQLYLDTMFSIYDRRIEMFGQKCFVLGYKGQSMLVHRTDQKEETFAILNESVDGCGNQSQAGTVVALMFATINMEKEGKKTAEEVVEIYEKLAAICAANADGKYADKYAEALEKITNVTGPYLTCETLVPMAEKNFEAHKEDVDWLRRTVKLLKIKKCYEADVFSQVAEAYFKLEPSSEGAEGMGKLFLGKKDYDKAIEFFKKALDMAETDEDRAQYSLSVAEAYLYAKSYSSAKSYALKAAGYKSGWGEPYMVIGDAYMYSASSCDDGKLGKYGAYWAAVDKYSKAKSMDSSVADEANKKIARASATYPVTKDVFFYSVKDGDSYTCDCWIGETTTVRTKQ